MIIYLCVKFDSNTLIFSKDIEQKPFSLHIDGMDVHTGSGDTVCLPPPIENGGGIIKKKKKKKKATVRGQK